VAVGSARESKKGYHAKNFDVRTIGVLVKKIVGGLLRECRRVRVPLGKRGAIAGGRARRMGSKQACLDPEGGKRNEFSFTSCRMPAT